MQVLLACSMNGSLMILTTKPLVALMLRVVSFKPLAVDEMDIDMSGGLCVTILNQLQRVVRDRVRRTVGDTDLNSARFSTPVSETEDTNATGRGMMPLIMRGY